MAALVSQAVPRIGRKGSVVPSALIFWMTVIILCGHQPGVQGDCQIDCTLNSYCTCVQSNTLCITPTFEETTSEGESLFNVTVTTDSPGNSTIKISDDTGDAETMFRVEGLQVFLNNSFDYESVEEYLFTIDCFDGSTWNTPPGSLNHQLKVDDENDNMPYFNTSIIYASIAEDADRGTILITDVPIRAYDLDTSDSGFEYYIMETGPFIVTAACQDEEVFLSFNGTVDFEEQENYTLTIVAADGCRSGFNPREGNVTVIVQVNDTDDKPPAFDEDSFYVTIPERNLTFVYDGISASDIDSLDAPLQYSFIGQSGDWGCLDYLTIDSETAEVTVSKELDYETSLTPCIITVQVVQVDNCMMIATTNLTVTVTDVNECPSFTSDSYSGQLTYDDPFVIVDDGSERLTIRMTDEDLVFNGMYAIKPSDTVSLVEIKGTEESRTLSYNIRFLDPTSVMTDTEIQISLSDNTTDVECDIATVNITVQLMPDSMAPNFTQINYHGNVKENATEGTNVIQVAALNSDMTSDGIAYRLQMASNGGEYIFSVDTESGEVSVALDEGIDAESIKQYTLIIEAVDERGTYYRSSVTSVIIDVIDVNEFPPMFFGDVIEEDIEEEVPMGFPVLTVQANDLDVDAVLEYSFLEPGVPFKIDTETGMITTDGRLDRDEGTTMYNITVVVTDGTNEDECLVMFTLTDINDNGPIFTGGPFEVSVSENATDTETIEATDIDEGVNAEIMYVLQSPEGVMFSVDNETGMVYANGPFDYESVKEYTLVIKASDPNFSTLTTVTVTVTDVNECPSFKSDSYSGQLTYDDPFVIVDDGSERLTIRMTDEDLVFNGMYAIEPSDTVELVEIKGTEDSRTRSYNIKFLDPTSVTTDTEIQISLSDDTTDVECDIATVNITVQLMPDSMAPNFTQISYHGNVLENATEGTYVIQVAALNSDMTSDGIAYRLQMASDGGEYIFSVNTESGEVSVAGGIDAESIKQYTLIIEAVDERGTYYRSSITSVIIDVIDINEFSPMFSEEVIEEDIEEEVTMGFPVLTVQANDLDVDAVLEYSFLEPGVPFKIDTETGMITTDGRLDRDEGTTMYNITVVVTDGTNEDECLVMFTLTDINDNAPVFTGGPFDVSVSENTTDTETIEIEATDIDEGANADIVYVLESPEGNMFSVDNETGMVYANGPFDYESVKEYTLVIKASDPNFSTLTTVLVTITDVNEKAPVFKTPCSSIEVLEDARIDDVICTVEAKDVDDDCTDAITYSLYSSMGVVPFTVDGTGEIKISDGLDRETEDNYTFIIIAEDSGQPPFSSNTTITVTVLDVNDEDPIFEETAISLRLQVDDLANPPVVLLSVKATDDDLPPWDIIQCEKTSGEESFVVLTGQDGSCDIYAYENLATSPDPYMFSLYAFNPDNRARRSQNVTLSVDIRDTVCYVAFNETDYDVIILKSDLDPIAPVITLEVTSNCNSDDVMFELLSQSYRSDTMDGDAQPSQNFTLDEQTGDIYPTNNVMEGEHVLLVSAYNQSDSGVNETTTVRITVTGVNQEPAFSKTRYTANISSDSMVMVMVIDLGTEVTDDDYPSFATGEVVFCEVNETESESGSSSDYFSVSSVGKVWTTQDNLIKINVGTFKLVVMVMDGAVEPLSDSAEVVINVDVDQTMPVVVPPMITKNCDDTVEIEEEIDPPQIICDIDASSTYDDQVVFGLDSFSEYFVIDADSGVINTSMKFDYEAGERSFTLLVYAEGTTSKLRNYTLISVTVVDVNDNAPDFSESQLAFSMEENRHGSTDCITFVGLIRSTDADSEINQNVTYTTDNEDFEVQGNDLTAVTCISRNAVNYSTGQVEFWITALNIGIKVNQTTVDVIVVNVEDLNDNAPKFVNDPEEFSVVRENLTFGVIVFTGNAEDDDTGPYNSEFIFSLAEGQTDVIYSLFQMSSDGLLTVRDITISDEYLTDVYEVIVMVTDKGQPPLNSSKTVTVYVGIIDVTKPYFPLEDRIPTIEINENAEDCRGLPVPLICNSTDAEVEYELEEVVPESGTDFFSIIGNELCIEELDREFSPSYTVSVKAKYTDTNVCNPTDGTTRKRRAVEAFTEVGSNTIVFTVTVNDVIDIPPSLQFPGNRTNHAYYLAAIDSRQFGSDVLTVTATDGDASWEFTYELTSLSGDNVEGPKNTIIIDGSTGRITTNSLLYPWLRDSVSWAWEESNFPGSRTQDPYNVTVCDVSAYPAAPQCDSAPLTFKILLSFEHIIIRVNTPVASIVPQQDTIIRCIAKKMDPTNNLELYLQFLSPVTETMTDIWLYGVNTTKLPSSPYLKFDDFQSIWEKTEGLSNCSDGEMTPTRLRLSKQLNVSSTTSTSIDASVLIALGIIVFIGNLICIIILLVSWRTMLEDGGKHLVRELTVKGDNLYEKLEKGIVNPVFNYDDEDDAEIMATEAEEDAAGSEEPLITTVYLTDGKTQSTIAMTANDEPTNVTKAVGTDDDALILPPPPTGREYDSVEESLDIYPFDDSSDEEDTTTAPNVSNFSAATPDVDLSAAVETLPPVDYETETKNKDGLENKEKKMEAESSTGASDSGVEPDDPHKDYDYPPPPRPKVQETRPVMESPVDDKTDDVLLPPPLPPILPPIVPPIDYADGKTVTFGGETVVGEGAGDGGSTTTDQDTASEASARSSTTEDTNQTPTKGMSHPSFTAELERVVASMNVGKSYRPQENDDPPLSPQSGGESEGESIGYLDDESVISASEIGVTSL